MKLLRRRRITSREEYYLGIKPERKRVNWRRVKWATISILAIMYVVVVGGWWLQGSQ